MKLLPNLSITKFYFLNFLNCFIEVFEQLNANWDLWIDLNIDLMTHSSLCPSFCVHFAFPALVCVVRAEGIPYLCQTDEVGEICVSSGSTGVAYYGLPGMTKNIFEVGVSLFL